MKKLLVSIFLVSAIALGGLFALPGQVFAQEGEGGAGAQSEGSPSSCKPGSGGSFLRFPTWYKYLDGERTAGNNCTPVIDLSERPEDLAKILLAVFEIILRVAGLVAVIFVIWGGFVYLLSQGEPDKIKGARETIVHALVGLAIAVSATAIVNLVARNIA